MTKTQWFRNLLITTGLVLAMTRMDAQEVQKTRTGTNEALQSIIIEKYAVASAPADSDTVGNPIPAGSVTYRIYADMLPGCRLQAVYGNQSHTLYFKTSTRFYNDRICHAETGFNIDAKKLHVGHAALDSWITIGAASRIHTGIPRCEDHDGFSFLTPNNPLSEADGLTKAVLGDFQIFNIDLGFFDNDSTASEFNTSNGGWACKGGLSGPTTENRVLIAQLTTNGLLAFGLNLQIGTPDGNFLQYVYNEPIGDEITFRGLSSSIDKNSFTGDLLFLN
jgi:hypothetical protein